MGAELLAHHLELSCRLRDPHGWSIGVGCRQFCVRHAFGQKIATLWIQCTGIFNKVKLGLGSAAHFLMEDTVLVIAFHITIVCFDISNYSFAL